MTELAQADAVGSVAGQMRRYLTEMLDDLGLPRYVRRRV
jgi:DNA-directed RNA polymerase subunit N (RpoN/RPB10)